MLKRRSFYEIQSIHCDLLLFNAIPNSQFIQLLCKIHEGVIREQKPYIQSQSNLQYIIENQVLHKSLALEEIEQLLQNSGMPLSKYVLKYLQLLQTELLTQRNCLVLLTRNCDYLNDYSDAI